MYDSFKAHVGDRVSKKIEVEYVFQEFDTFIPSWYNVPAERTKPFGTAHALLCAKNAVDSPFCVFNADDYYGNECFKTMHHFLENVDNSNPKYFLYPNQEVESIHHFSLHTKQLLG